MNIKKSLDSGPVSKCQTAGLQTPDRIIGLRPTMKIMRLIGLEPAQRKSGTGLGGSLPDFQAKNWDFLAHLALSGRGAKRSGLLFFVVLSGI